MTVLEIALMGIAVALVVLNIYQYLTQRAVLRLAQVLFAMSVNVRDKSKEVRKNGKDIEIIEAHLFDIFTTVRTLVEVFGKTDQLEARLLEEQRTAFGRYWNDGSDSMLRLASEIVDVLSEESPDTPWPDVERRALDQFVGKIPNVDREMARKIINAVAGERNRV